MADHETVCADGSGARHLEVVVRFDADDNGDGRVTFPARPVGDPPTVACSDRFAVG